MATTDFRILGPLEVVDAGQLVRLAGARQRALLAILLLRVGEAISSDRPIDELWDEEPPDAGSAALRVRISQRRRLGPAGELLVTRPPGYALAVAPERVDLRRFERLVEAGDRALGNDDPAAAVDSVRDPGRWAEDAAVSAPTARVEDASLVAVMVVAEPPQDERHRLGVTRGSAVAWSRRAGPRIQRRGMGPISCTNHGHDGLHAFGRHF